MFALITVKKMVMHQRNDGYYYSCKLLKECHQIPHEIACDLSEEGSVNDVTVLTGGCVLILSRNFVQYACFGLFGIIALQVRKPFFFFF